MDVTRQALDVASFDPRAGTTLVAPDGAGPGHWVGAASLARGPDGEVLAAYRHRSPDDRGHQCVVAELQDGVPTPRWQGDASELDTPSLERPALVATRDGRWRLFVSYVESATGQWQVDVVEADRPEDFDLATARPVLTAADTDTEGVKDPCVVVVDGVWFLFVNVVRVVHHTAPRPERGEGGDVVLPTGLATSLDGAHFAWHGVVLPAGPGWDARMARITAVVPLPRGHLAFYDGRPTAERNFEEQVGLAWSVDLLHWVRLTPDGPWRTSPHGGGALRYLDALVDDHTTRLLYEYARPDGSHELRQTCLDHPSG
jgi:hypothetical protein